MADKSIIDWTDPNAWGDLRLAVRMRLAASFKYLLHTGHLNRADVQRIGEVSIAQASADIRLMKEMTGALIYDPSWKRYVVKPF
jgi:hypothetical protein